MTLEYETNELIIRVRNRIEEFTHDNVTSVPTEDVRSLISRLERAETERAKAIHDWAMKSTDNSFQQAQLKAMEPVSEAMDSLLLAYDKFKRVWGPR